MPKSFTAHERAEIKAQLLQACEDCWSRYGYKKTSVAQICTMAGISVGAFYQFYESKEELFIDTAEVVGQRLVSITTTEMPQHPTKAELGETLKRVARELRKVDWFLSLRDEIQILARKMPPDALADRHLDALTMTAAFFEEHDLHPLIPPDQAAITVQILFMLLLHDDVVADGRFEPSFDFIIDATIDRLFD